MGTSDFALVLEAVSQLEVDLRSLRTHADDLESTPSVRALPSFVHLRAVLRRVLATMRDVRTGLVEVSIGSRSVERRESALHARAVVIALQLAVLKDAERELPQSFWSSGRAFASVAEFTRFLCQEIGRVNAEYLSARRLARPDDRDALLAIVTDAEHALDALGRDPSLACFIAAGASLRVEKFRVACRTIGTLLDVPLVPEPNPWTAAEQSGRS